MNLGKVCLLAAMVFLSPPFGAAAECPLSPPVPDYAALTEEQIGLCTTKLGIAISEMEDIVRAANGRTAFNKDEAGKLDGEAWIPVREGDLIDRFAYRLHREYKRLKVASKRLPDHGKRERLLKYTSESVHRLMASRGLREPLAAVLDTGFVLGDSGNSAIPYARPSSEKTAYGVVDWESKHFRDDEDGRYDFSFGGRFGLMPALALVNRADKPGVRTLYQQAFQWNFNGRVNVDFGEEGGELSLLGRFGQAQLMSETEAVGTQEAPVATKLLENGVGRSALYYEGGVEYRLFDNPLSNVHEDKTYLAPVFAISTGLRHDRRYRIFGDVLKGFHNPEQRWFFRATVNLNKVIDRRPEDGKPKSYALGFAVDYDAPLRRSDPAKIVPSGTKIILTANFDVLSTLSRGVKK